MFSNFRRGTVSLCFVTLALAGLTACGSDGAGSYDLSSLAKAKAVSCKQVVKVSNAVTAADNATPRGKRMQMLRDMKLDSANVTAVSDALTKREKSCSNEPEPTSTPTATSCPAPFAQTDIHDAALARFVKGGIDASSVKNANAKMLENVGHSADYLHIIAAKTFRLSDVPSAEKMVTASCLNAAGQKTLSRLKDVTSASGMRFAQAPAGAFNSGVDKNGKAVVSSKAGLRGNLKAIQYTLPNKSRVYILVRCGNPVFPSKPAGIPTGKTDNPAPPKQHVTPPPPSHTPPTHNSPPPPRTVTPKNPSLDPAPRGHAPIGGGHNASNGPGKPSSKPTFSSKPRQNPKPPSRPSTPPKGSTPTHGGGSTPPPETGSNPSGGGANSGDPGGF